MSEQNLIELGKFNAKMWGAFLPAIIAAGVMKKADAIAILEAAIDPPDGDAALRATGTERKLLEIVLKQVRAVPDPWKSPALN